MTRWQIGCLPHPSTGSPQNDTEWCPLALQWLTSPANKQTIPTWRFLITFQNRVQFQFHDFSALGFTKDILFCALTPDGQNICSGCMASAKQEKAATWTPCVLSTLKAQHRDNQKKSHLKTIYRQTITNYKYRFFQNHSGDRYECCVTNNMSRNWPASQPKDLAEFALPKKSRKWVVKCIIFRRFYGTLKTRESENCRTQKTWLFLQKNLLLGYETFFEALSKWVACYSAQKFIVIFSIIFKNNIKFRNRDNNFCLNKDNLVTKSSL
jgi:hypothetical protein